MNSSSNRHEEEAQRQIALRKQIALLQAQLVEIPDHSVAMDCPTSPKRKQPEERLLVPATPSPRKKRKIEPSQQKQLNPARLFQSTTRDDQRIVSSHRSGSISDKNSKESDPRKTGSSSFLNNLASIHTRSVMPTTPAESVSRTTAFKERPHSPRQSSDLNSNSIAPLRDDRLALIEELEPGPYHHTPPSDDPLFSQLEPNSGIRLLSRSLPHEDLQDYLRGRYYVSPSKLYSIIRLLPDKQGYDVPVSGDWVTIAVIAERGPIKFTRAPVTIDPEDGEQDTEAKRSEHRKPIESKKPSGKKFVNIKLVDFGARSRTASSATGGKAVIRGDAFLSLLLFESDSFDLVTREDGGRPEKVYKGGSQGAFEALTKLKEGDVVALLNPRILKPFQKSADTPHPVNNILAVTPESAASAVVIGRSRDLGMCTVLKRDGKACGSWCDKRVSDVCEYHLQNAVQRQRAGRAEFSIGTSGLSTTSKAKRKTEYDPARQWGLKPDETRSSGGATYVVSGHVVSGSSLDSRTVFATESIGREGQAKAKRKSSAREADQALKAMLEKDKDGMKAVMKAREIGQQNSSAKQEWSKLKGKKDVQNSSKDSRVAKRQEKNKESDTPLLEATTQKYYSATIIKQLGFDPSIKAGHKKSGDSTMQDKLTALRHVGSARKEIELGRRPGRKAHSTVHTPLEQRKKNDTNSCGALDSDDELPEGVLDPVVTESAKAMVDLDDL